uniref:Uncharacterized protein n=1 Tax=viral metagenome TaxID=1070528 RepID=A0A6M3LAZ2_9ZZZZ
MSNWAGVLKDNYPNLYSLRERGDTLRWEDFFLLKIPDIDIENGEVEAAVIWAISHAECPKEPTPTTVVRWIRDYRRSKQRGVSGIAATIKRIDTLPDAEAWEYLCGLPQAVLMELPLGKWKERFACQRAKAAELIRRQSAPICRTGKTTYAEKIRFAKEKRKQPPRGAEVK